MLTTHAISKVSDRICLELMRGGIASCPQKFEWVEPSGGSVAFPRLADGSCSREFGDRLYRQTDVLVLPGEAFDCPGFFRIRLGADQEEFALAMDRMAEFLKGNP